MIEKENWIDCPTCHYARPEKGKCPNPACYENLSPERIAILEKEKIKRQAEEAERQRIRDIQTRMGTWKRS